MRRRGGEGHGIDQRAHEGGVAAHADAEDAHEHAEELIQEKEAADGGGADSSDEFGRLALQPKSLGKGDGGERDDEEGHQTAIGEGAAKHVDQTFAPRLDDHAAQGRQVMQGGEIGAERDAGKQASENRGGDDDERGLEAKGEANSDDEEAGKASPFGKRGGEKHGG